MGRYVEQVPRYQYPMPCGRTFESHTYFEDTGEEIGVPCKCPARWHLFDYPEIRALEIQPRERSTGSKPGRKIGEGRNGMPRRLDDAMIQDRIAADLWNTQGRVPAEEIATRHAVSEITVKRVGIDIGVYQPNRTAAKDPEELALEQRCRKYGITAEEYRERLDAQGGVCKICGNDEPGGVGSWHIDHDHACCPDTPACGDCVRGILCQKCNIALGLAGDDKMRLLQMFNYIDNWQG